MANSNAKVAAVAAGTVAAASLLGATAAHVRRRYCLQVVRTSKGIARVHMIDAEGGEPVRVLSWGGVYQSATYLGERRFEPVFEYYRGFNAMFGAEPALGRPIARVLMLGGGGFAYPKHLLTAHENIQLDVVESEGGIIRAARRWFYLDDLEERLADPAEARGCSLRVIEGDGRAFLEYGAGRVNPARHAAAPAYAGFAADGAGGLLRALGTDELAVPCYDAIVNDAFAGREPARALATAEAARAVRRRLAPGGLYLANVVSAGGGADVSFLRDEVATLGRVFAHVHVLQTSDAAFGGEDNYLVVATDGDASFAEAIPYDEDFPGTVLEDSKG